MRSTGGALGDFNYVAIGIEGDFGVPPVWFRIMWAFDGTGGVRGGRCAETGLEDGDFLAVFDCFTK